MKDLIACCGLDCEKCDVRIATVNDDDALREKTAKFWSELNHAEITKDMMNCMGCRVDGVKTVFCDSMCEIRKCAYKNGFNTCGECPEIDTCKKVGEITAHNTEALKNLKDGAQ